MREGSELDPNGFPQRTIIFDNEYEHQGGWLLHTLSQLAHLKI